MTGNIFAEYECEGVTLTVEVMVVELDGPCVTIVSSQFPRVFVRHQGWCEQPQMTIDRKHLRNIRMVTSVGEIVYPKDSIEAQTSAAYGQAGEELGTRFIVSDGEVVKFGSKLWFDGIEPIEF